MNPWPLLLKFVRLADKPKEDEPLNILLVDDSDNDLKILGKILRSLKQNHVPFDNLAEADAALGVSNYDGVLLDIKFQNGNGRNGIAFCEHIRKTHKDLPVIFISGALHHADVPTLPRGLIQVIIKPDKYDDTFLAVEQAVMIFAMHRERKLHLTARLSSASGTILLAIIGAFLAGRFWPQLSQLIDALNP